MAKSKKEPLASRQKRAARIIALLKKYYPDAQCSLEHNDPLELLISTMLSAQCTDERVNKVTPELFKKLPTVKDYASVRLPTLEKLVHSTGFYRNKAKNIKACCKDIVKNHDGQVPDTMEELVKLAGVGRKTANVVLGNIFDKPGMVVDTHVTRLSNRLGLAEGKDAVKLEFELQKVIEEKDWTNFGHLIIQHGRAVCKARKPSCQICFLQENCPKIGVD